MYTVQRQRTIMPSTWEGVEIEKVNRIPEGGMDGLKGTLSRLKYDIL